MKRKLSDDASLSYSQRNLKPFLLLSITIVVDLPMEILHQILIRVGGKSLRDLCAAKACCKTFGNVANDPFFYKKIELFGMYIPAIMNEDVKRFLHTCLQHGNLSALFIKGATLLLRRGNLSYGLAMIDEAAQKGYDIAKYTSANIRRIIFLGVDPNYDLFGVDRAFLQKIRLRVAKTQNLAWRYKFADEFVKYLDLIHFTDFYGCPCGSYLDCIDSPDENHVITNVICSKCFWIIQNVAFVDELAERIIEWPE